MQAAASPAQPLASPEPQSNTARQLQAGREALAQAQSLWAAGSHDAATDLLQQAISLTERAGVSTPASLQLLSNLVRELARMWLADGRAAASLEVLTRLEPVLGRDPDVWALRGNAAQRLGRHQDSVRAYAAALQLRPNEARWLLGAAVSHAALGQTAQASELAAKARTLGPISKEVQAYLRQAGVQISEP
jgi:MSHA biogenesis protein MshN